MRDENADGNKKGGKNIVEKDRQTEKREKRDLKIVKDKKHGRAGPNFILLES